MNWALPRPRGGYVTTAALLALLIVDLWLSRRYAAALASCCDPSDHVADIFAASGVAVAFVLTYLATLAALPSPGRELLASALLRLGEVGPPGVHAQNPEAHIAPDEFTSIQRYLDDTRDSEPNSQSLMNACAGFRHVLDLARPPHERPPTSAERLMDLGYSRFRAVFLAEFVYRKDAEKCNLLRATVLAALVFSYAVIIDGIHFFGQMEGSAALLLAYPILGLIGVGFAAALALRMWPHEVHDNITQPIIDVRERLLQRTIRQQVASLNPVIAKARARATRAAPRAVRVTPSMISAGQRRLEAALDDGVADVLRDVYTAMNRAAP